MWDHLVKPFRPGTVVPSKTARHWNFTFVDGEGNEHYNRTVDWQAAYNAKKHMRMFCATIGENNKMKELVHEMYETQEESGSLCGVQG